MTVGTALDVQGRGPRKPGEPPVVVDYRIATPGYLRALGVPFVQGRDLAGSDSPNSADAVVVNQAAARQLWPNESPIGKQIRPRFEASPAPWVAEADPRERWLTVVGVAANIKEFGRNDRERAEIYLSYVTTQRSQEIAIRMALDARTRDILVMVLREIRFLAIIAVLTGWIASACLARTLKSVLF